LAFALVGDHFESAGLRFEVVDMDRHRVDKLLVRRFDEKPAAAHLVGK
jgi:putative hemolysin